MKFKGIRKLKILKMLKFNFTLKLRKIGEIG